MNEHSIDQRDHELEELIESELLHDDRISSQHVKVEVTNGEARLTGTVNSFRRKLAMQQIVAAYEGIRRVQNELNIEPGVMAPDEEIVLHVRAALDSSADVTKETVTVSVVGGKVTLTGNVSGHWKRVVAEDVTRGVRGVRDVVNMLVVDVRNRIDDFELTKSIQAALMRARGLKDTDIAIAIGNDTVVLSGTVNEPWQCEVAETVVGGFGLLHIRNNIQISN